MFVLYIQIIKLLFVQRCSQHQYLLLQIKFHTTMNIAAEDNCKLEFQNLKYRKNEARYIVFSIQQQKIVIQKVGNKTESWSQFLTILPENDYRYAVFDFEFKNVDGMLVSKLIFVSWNPDTAPLKRRVLYATAKQNFKKYLDLNSKDFNVCSKNDVTEEDVIKEFNK